MINESKIQAMRAVAMSQKVMMEALGEGLRDMMDRGISPQQKSEEVEKQLIRLTAALAVYDDILGDTQGTSTIDLSAAQTEAWPAPKTEPPNGVIFKPDGSINVQASIGNVIDGMPHNQPFATVDIEDRLKELSGDADISQSAIYAAIKAFVRSNKISREERGLYRRKMKLETA